MMNSKKWLPLFMLMAAVGFSSPGVTPGSGSDTFALLSDVYINNNVQPFTYGGVLIPTRPFSVLYITYYVRTSGSGGSTNNTFQISDGVGNTCNCLFSCSQSTAVHVSSCVTGAGNGCKFAAGSNLSFAFPAVGDCTTSTDVQGNLAVMGSWL